MNDSLAITLITAGGFLLLQIIVLNVLRRNLNKRIGQDPPLEKGVNTLVKETLAMKQPTKTRQAVLCLIALGLIVAGGVHFL